MKGSLCCSRCWGKFRVRFKLDAGHNCFRSHFRNIGVNSDNLYETRRGWTQVVFTCVQSSRTLHVCSPHALFTSAVLTHFTRLQSARTLHVCSPHALYTSAVLTHFTCVQSSRTLHVCSPHALHMCAVLTHTQENLPTWKLPTCLRPCTRKYGAR